MNNMKKYLLALFLAMGLLLIGFNPAPVEAALAYQQVNLVSNGAVPAAHTDTNLVNPWGISFSPTGPFWVSDNGTGLATIYNGAGTPQALVVIIPPPVAGVGHSAPTGQVFNGTADFGDNRFIFATEDGIIASWKAADGTNAVIHVNNSAITQAVYKGLASGVDNVAGNVLYATDFANGRIDPFDKNFAPAPLGGAFTDPTLPAGFAPFGIRNINGSLYVTYAMQDAAHHDDVAGPGNGFVDVFDTGGNFIKRLISNGALNSPWGLALAPSDFGPFSNALLVGNFGDGRINAFDPATGSLLGTLSDASNIPIAIDGLWDLTFGNGAAAGATNELFFSAGINAEADGLFGKIQVIPEPFSLSLLALGGLALLRKRRA